MKSLVSTTFYKNHKRSRNQNYALANCTNVLYLIVTVNLKTNFSQHIVTDTAVKFERIKIQTDTRTQMSRDRLTPDKWKE